MLSVILPVYNECNRLAASIDRLDNYLAANYDRYEIIIVEDCSTDGSYEIASHICEYRKNTVLLHNDRRLGRGASLAIAIRKARGKFVAYMDTDLATDLSHVRELIGGLARGASVTTGSRLMRGARIERPADRDIASKAYNSLARLLFGSRIHDHQCGFKGFNKRDILDVIGQVRDNHWFWDTELLIICQHRGLKVSEFPVRWVHNGGNSMNASKVKVLKDSYVMGKKLLELKLRLSVNHSRK